MNKYLKKKQENKDSGILKTRCLSSILVVVAAFLSLTIQFNDQETTNPDFE